MKLRGALFLQGNALHAGVGAQRGGTMPAARIKSWVHFLALISRWLPANADSGKQSAWGGDQAAAASLTQYSSTAFPLRQPARAVF